MHRFQNLCTKIKLSFNYIFHELLEVSLCIQLVNYYSPHLFSVKCHVLSHFICVWWRLPAFIKKWLGDWSTITSLSNSLSLTCTLHHTELFFVPLKPLMITPPCICLECPWLAHPCSFKIWFKTSYHSIARVELMQQITQFSFNSVDGCHGDDSYPYTGNWNTHMFT